MSTTTTQASSPVRRDVTRQRRPGVVAMSALALTIGLTCWSVAFVRGDNTAALVGIVIASTGLTFFFPALQTFLSARRPV